MHELVRIMEKKLPEKVWIVVFDDESAHIRELHYAEWGGVYTDREKRIYDVLSETIDMEICSRERSSELAFDGSYMGQKNWRGTTGVNIFSARTGTLQPFGEEENAKKYAYKKVVAFLESRRDLYQGAAEKARKEMGALS